MREFRSGMQNMFDENPTDVRFEEGHVIFEFEGGKFYKWTLQKTFTFFLRALRDAGQKQNNGGME